MEIKKKISEKTGKKGKKGENEKRGKTRNEKRRKTNEKIPNFSNYNWEQRLKTLKI